MPLLLLLGCSQQLLCWQQLRVLLLLPLLLYLMQRSGRLSLEAQPGLLKGRQPCGLAPRSRNARRTLRQGVLQLCQQLPLERQLQAVRLGGEIQRHGAVVVGMAPQSACQLRQLGAALLQPLAQCLLRPAKGGRRLGDEGHDRGQGRAAGVQNQSAEALQAGRVAAAGVGGLEGQEVLQLLPARRQLQHRHCLRQRGARRRV